MAGRIKKLQDRYAVVLQRMDDILDTADKDDRGLSADETGEYEALDKEHREQLIPNLSREEALQDAERKLAAKEGTSEPPANPLVSGAVGHDGASLKPFPSFGEFLQAVHQAAVLPQSIDPRLPQLAAVLGGSTGVPSDGGYLVQTDFIAEVFRRQNEVAQLAPRCKQVTVGPNSDGVELNYIDETTRTTGNRWGGVQVYWGEEAEAATAKKPKLGKIKLSLEDLIGLSYMTDRQLEDASAMTGIVGDGFAEEFAFVLDDALFRGTGAGQPQGLLNFSALVSVAKENGQTATTFVFENLIKMWSRLYARSRANAVWFYNIDMEPAFAKMALPVGTGGVSVYLPPTGVSGSPFSTLYGRPMVPIEHAATLGTKGDIILADMSQVLLIEKGGLKADSSAHLKFDTYQTAFRWKRRVNAAPLWQSALTPYQGTNTVSPYVSLDTRS